MPQCETSKECGAAWVAESTPLARARAIKMRLRAASKKAADARKEWTAARVEDDLDGGPRTSEWYLHQTGAVTLRMWKAERNLAAIAEEWRACLAERAAMPKAERWNLASVERWAVIADALEKQP